MPIWIDHLLFLTLAVLFPLRATTFGYRRLVRAAEADVPRVRVALYRQALTIQWSLAALVGAVWFWQRRPASALGLTLGTPQTMIPFSVAFAAFAVFLLWQRRSAILSDSALARLRARMAHFERMLPHSREDLAWFDRLAVTAGVCEELLYRGYLIWYLGHWFGPYGGAGLAALLFGLGHSYQGVRGILATGALGLIFGAIYLATGSILLPAILHALIDIHSGHLLQAAYTREPRADPGPESDTVTRQSSGNGADSPVVGESRPDPVA